jgi:hypothetical protein
MARYVPLTHEEFAVICARIDAGEPSRADVKAATKHLAALLVQKAPGASVEVRIPPYAAVQVVAGARHTRGTPPAVVEMEPLTWIAVGRGRLAWADAPVRASGERSDLSALMPLDVT